MINYRLPTGLMARRWVRNLRRGGFPARAYGALVVVAVNAEDAQLALFAQRAAAIRQDGGATMPLQAK
jgi:hypothetical protein